LTLPGCRVVHHNEGENRPLRADRKEKEGLKQQIQAKISFELH